MKRLATFLLLSSVAFAVGATCLLEEDATETIILGPFIDDTDFSTAETALTISQADVQLWQEGDSAFAQKADATACTHRASGFYSCPLNATDTATAGDLFVQVAETGALIVKKQCQVLGAQAYASLHGSDSLQVHVTEYTAGVITATAIATDAIGAAELAADAIGASELATDAIGAAEIATAAIANDEFAVTETLTANPAAGGIVDASLGGALEIVFETDFATNYNTTSDAWVTNFTNVIGTYNAQTGDSFARLGAPAGASVSADIAAIEAQTDDIGTAGAGLDGIPWNTAWDAEVATELTDIGLQYLVNTALPTSWSANITANSALDYLGDDGTAVFDRTTDSQQAIADGGGGGPTAAQIVDEWESQSQIDPTGFHVNVIETGGTAQTANDNGADINAILADTNELQTDDIPGTIAALNDITAASVWAVDATTSQGQGTFGQAIGDPAADSDTIWGLVNTNVDATISSRGTSTLTASDNIGINWADVTNATATLALSGTTVDLVADAVDSAAIATTGADEIRDTIITADEQITVSSGVVDADLEWIEGGLIPTETTPGRMAVNFGTFWDNADAVTSSVVDDVGGVGGTGLTAEQTRAALGGFGGNITTASSQVLMDLSNGPSTADVLNDTFTMTITDASNSDEPACHRRIIDWSATTQIAELDAACGFTVADGDGYIIMPNNVGGAVAEISDTTNPLQVGADGLLAVNVEEVNDVDLSIQQAGYMPSTIANNTLTGGVTTASGVVDADLEWIDDGLIPDESSPGRMAANFGTLLDNADAVSALTLDAVSTLSASDNVGVNWGDITNQSTSVTLSGTTVGIVTDLAAGSIGPGDFANDAITDAAVANDVQVDAVTLAGTAALTQLVAGVDAAIEGLVALNDVMAYCIVDSANFTPTSTDFQCDPTDLDGGALTLANDLWAGRQMTAGTGAYIGESRYINGSPNPSVWDNTNSEIKLITTRAWPAALADGVIVLIH